MLASTVGRAAATPDRQPPGLLERLRRLGVVLPSRAATNCELVSELKLGLAELERRLANYKEVARSDAGRGR